MNDSPGNSHAENAPPSHSQQMPEQPVYTYASAGIAERQGSVPIWLWVVVILLVIWGFYYLVAFWNDPLALS